MAWELLPVNYTDAVWSGLKRYNEVRNEDGTVSFQDVTVYSNKETSFFGAKDANRMNEALNTLMSMVENGTDLYTAFQNYFNTQKGLFEDTANATQQGFNEYVDGLKAEGDSAILTIKTDYRKEITDFENQQEQLFTTWFEFVKGQLAKMLPESCRIRLTHWTSKLTASKLETLLSLMTARPSQRPTVLRESRRSLCPTAPSFRSSMTTMCLPRQRPSHSVLMD